MNHPVVSPYSLRHPRREISTRLEGTVALITGAASGIGRASAEMFAREGSRVIVADGNPTLGAQTVDSIRASGGTAVFTEVDISQPLQVDGMVQTALEAYGRIDILLNAAGVLQYGTVLETEPADWNRILTVNLTGTYLCCRAVIPSMVRQGRGSIINVASTTGAHDACARAAAYVSSKGGVTLLTRAMAIDHARQGIRVNAICPGPTDTPMLRNAMTAEQLQAFANTFPMGRLGRPDEIAKAALFLASEDASFITGSCLYVDGGQTAEV